MRLDKKSLLPRALCSGLRGVAVRSGCVRTRFGQGLIVSE